jgi:pyruvate dehydrogenase E2 component (dihydrolipoamide acetyltransferase)
MVKDVIVPDIGDYQNVEIIEILVKVGDLIAVDDELLTLETDKAAMAIPANVAGKITALNVKVGDKVSRGSVILSLEEVGASNSNQHLVAAIVENAVAVSQEVIVTVPDIGIGGKVAIIEINVSVGDTIAIDTAIITLESEKAAMEIPSPLSGTVSAILVKVGDNVGFGDKILSVTSEVQAQVQVQTPLAAPMQPIKLEQLTPLLTQVAPIQSPAPYVKKTGHAHAGPSVRRFARELGVDLMQVEGTARKGRIARADITKYVKQTLTGGHNSQAVSNASNFNVAAMPEVNFSDFGPVTSAPLSRIKKLSGNFLHRNWVRIPHVTHFDSADITELEDFRNAQKDIAEKHGVKLTPLVFLMKAVVAALKAFPIFNSSLSADGEQLIMKNYYHIGVAVDTPNGLVVPVVRDVDNKGLFELARDLSVLSSKAREGKLTAREMQGGCFSISSLGGIGGTGFTPIVNAPEVAILGVVKAKIQPLYQHNAFVPRLMLPLSLSYDHRVVDGADAARFCAFMVEQLSDIRRLLL